MHAANANRYRPSAIRVAVLPLAAIVIAACTTTESSRTPAAKIEIQEAVGFTITEEARVSSNIRVDYDQALKLLEQGEVEPGIQKLEAVIEAAPDLSAPRIDLGIAYHVAGNLDAAERNLLLALESNPEHPIAHNELGIVYRKTGRFDAARRSYEAALSVYPGYHYARRNLAVLCDLYLGDLDCALANYEAYLATVPIDDEASMWVTDLRYRMGQGEQ
ncbi:MAG: tetratricopeptide repeat protein [Gammaproteobacteria bacterium]|nr:tetratricopeptide repeat protein [Gammaproteobacteria bacterium]MDH3428802.1 tetratricopeptide repeat protein [Gammaproteobacteria bacterium]MDH3432367.1 tetratricopeptide repeat protein [Gammaproteobacteria bacterium]